MAAAASKQAHASGRKKPSRPTPAQARQRAKVEAAECSWRWSQDIWHGHDVDYLGRRTGSGSGKVLCHGHPGNPGCGRLVPPQDVATDHAAPRWPPRRGMHGPPPPPAFLCQDCRTRAWAPGERRPDASDAAAHRIARFELVGSSRLGEYAVTEFVDLVDAETSPTTAALDAMAAVGGGVRGNDRLPAGGDDADHELLAAAVAAFEQTAAAEGIAVAVRKFEDVTGQTAAAAAQARRYRTSRAMTV